MIEIFLVFTNLKFLFTVVDPGTKERHQKRISFCRQITTKGKKSEVPYKENHKHLNKQGWY